MNELTIQYKGHDVQLTDVDYSPGYPAKTFGPPESCYPAESADIDFTITTGNQLLDLILTENHLEEITGLAFEAVEEQLKADAEARAEQAYDEQHDWRWDHD